MVEGQEIVRVRPRVVHLVFGVIVLKPECARPFAEVHGQAAADGNYVGAIRLKDRAIGLGARFVCPAALQGLRRLAILQVQARAEAAACRWVGRALDNQPSLVQAEAVAGHVVGAQQVDAPGGAVEVVTVVAVEGKAERRLAEEVRWGFCPLGGFGMVWTWSARCGHVARKARGMGRMGWYCVA